MSRVALVEDNPDNRLLVTALLAEVDHETVEFDSGEAALAGLAEASVDIILLDISLPQMSGLEVLTRLRSDPELSSIPVVALTAHAMADDRAHYLASGFDAYVAKPILDENDLFGAIDRLIGKARA